MAQASEAIRNSLTNTIARTHHSIIHTQYYARTHTLQNYPTGISAREEYVHHHHTTNAPRGTPPGEYNQDHEPRGTPPGGCDLDHTTATNGCSHSSSTSSPSNRIGYCAARHYCTTGNGNVCCDCTDHNPYTAIRVGQASKPGPPRTPADIGIDTHTNTVCSYGRFAENIQHAWNMYHLPQVDGSTEDVGHLMDMLFNARPHNDPAPDAWCTWRVLVTQRHLQDISHKELDFVLQELSANDIHDSEPAGAVVNALTAPEDDEEGPTTTPTTHTPTSNLTATTVRIVTGNIRGLADNLPALLRCRSDVYLMQGVDLIEFKVNELKALAMQAGY